VTGCPASLFRLKANVGAVSRYFFPSGPRNLPESRRELGFSAAVPDRVKPDFLEGWKWLKAIVGKRRRADG
jgi:hypothetical protein